MRMCHREERGSTLDTSTPIKIGTFGIAKTYDAVSFFIKDCFLVVCFLMEDFSNQRGHSQVSRACDSCREVQGSNPGSANT